MRQNLIVGIRQSQGFGIILKVIELQQKKGWFTDARDNQTYYLDPNTGVMAIGWTNINGNMYYFNELSAMEANWYEVGGGFYESYGKKIKAIGSMFRDEKTSDGKMVDEKGKLIK